MKNIGLIFLFFSSLISFAQELEFQQKNGGLLLLENGMPRYFYRTSPVDTISPFARTNYIHPLYGLQGEVLTEDFPDDHLHHHGIFWAWHQLYARGERIADPWMNENIRWKIIKTETEVKEKEAILASEVLWINKTTSEAVIEENLLLTFKRYGNDIFSLDFSIKLTALVDGVAIGGSEDAKGYGGFSPRLKLPGDVCFTSVTGEVKPQNLPVQAGPWINISGHFNPSLDKPSGVVIMGEPEKLPSYQGWILRSASSMQNMAFPGRNTVSIEKGGSLTFRNQLLIHSGLSSEEIAEFYCSF
ncbi:DUF6807 family protein [Autumnicola musiva]|uniref:DUF6807 family protein n=1 Tax=Autumnicola musiva TaxID=3075589 RepID=A0ABU3D817_9FLAO|nr:DUF6807 family protein [Zunongwangia sp. F117]MDT0677649.1 DUF6807 family protein [Zunongwangia sp. F117]